MKRLFNHTKRPEQEWDENDDFQYEWDEEDSLEEKSTHRDVVTWEDDEEDYYYEDGSYASTAGGGEDYEETDYPEEGSAEEVSYTEEPVYAADTYAEEGYTEEAYSAETYPEEEYPDEYAEYEEDVPGETEDFDFEGEVTYSEADYVGVAGAAAYGYSESESYSEEMEYEDMEHIRRDPYLAERSGNKKAAAPVKRKKKQKDSSFIDICVGLTGVAVLLLAFALGWMIFSNKTQEKQVSGFASVGLQLSDINLIGEQGLLAVADAKIAKIQAAGAVEDSNNQPEDPDEPFGGYDENDISRQVEVVMNLTSIQKDLKIKFTNKKSGKLIPNVPFAVSIKDPDGKTAVWSDDDMDGIIYKKDITGGNYTLAMETLSDSKYSNYTISTAAKSFEVKKNIAYTKVDVENEIKTESEIDASKEDTKKNETTTESSLPDTVTWVESKVITSVYNEIAKTKIPDPLTLLDKSNQKTFSQLAITNSGLVVPKEATIKVGEELQLKAEANITSDKENETIKNVTLSNVTWSTLQPDYLSIDANGKIKGLKACDSTVKSAVVMFKADVTYTVETVVEKPGESEPSEPSSSEPESSEPSSDESESSEPSSSEPESSEPSSSEPESSEASSSEPESSEASSNQPEATESASSEAQTATPAPDNTEVTTKEVTEQISGSCAIVVISGKGTIKLEKEEYVIVPKEKVEVTAKAEGFAEGKELEYKLSCDKPELFKSAYVDNKGKITMEAGEKEGVIAMTLTANYKKEDGGTDDTLATFKFTVKVTNGMKITLEHETLNLYAEVPFELKTYVEFAGATAPKLTAVSSNENALKVIIGAAQSQGNGKYYYPVTLDTKTIASNVTVTFKVDQESTTAKEIKAVCVINILENPKKDKKTKLVDSEGEPIFVFENNDYREAVYADYYTHDKFFAKGEAKYTGWQTIGGKVYFFTAEGKKVTGEQVIQGAKYMFASDGSLVVGNGALGIDVSKWNGTIDWNAVKNSGVNYVIIRCGYRGSTQGSLVVDPKFTQNIKGATSAGLKVGVYFFTQAIDEREAVEEASMVLGLIKNYKISYPVFLDVEASGGRADSISKETRTAVCKAFCKTIQNGGYTAGIYANKNWLETKLDPSQLSAYKIWLAQYAATPTYSGRYELWQYRKNGKVSGISGDVDMNLSYLGY